MVILKFEQMKTKGYYSQEPTKCKHNISLNGDRTKFIDGVNYCSKCDVYKE